MTFFYEDGEVSEIMWEKYCRSGQATDGNTIPRMRFACSITKAIDKHGEYLTHICRRLKFFNLCVIFIYVT